ncbi:hypothetical protein VNO78_30528 [Psophocarpus tetragonolobus]|uniref:Transmembrane protein n=1 Tax=Psophocarpus tetragonolobus TaxID=3891 RepID=A0AAN9X5G5_PSOTE
MGGETAETPTHPRCVMSSPESTLSTWLHKSEPNTTPLISSSLLSTLSLFSTLLLFSFFFFLSSFSFYLFYLFILFLLPLLLHLRFFALRLLRFSVFAVFLLDPSLDHSESSVVEFVE